MDKSQELIASVLMCESADLPPESTPLRAIKGWDSLKHVLLIVGLERELKAQLTAEQIQRIITVSDVANLIRRKGNDA